MKLDVHLGHVLSVVLNLSYSQVQSPPPKYESENDDDDNSDSEEQEDVGDYKKGIGIFYFKTFKASHSFPGKFLS